MKKLVFLMLLLLLFCGCRASDPLELISEAIGADVRGGQLELLSDSTGGFHGDGTETVVIRLDAEQAAAFLTEIRDNGYWHPLPLSENLSAAVYGLHTETESFGPLFPEHTVPRVDRGFWFFEDRHSQAADPADDAALHSRSSWSFTAAIFDADTNTLYYLKLDT